MNEHQGIILLHHLNLNITLRNIIDTVLQKANFSWYQIIKNILEIKRSNFKLDCFNSNKNMLLKLDRLLIQTLTRD